MLEFSPELKERIHAAMQSYDGRHALGHVTHGNFYAVLNIIMDEAVKEIKAQEGVTGDAHG